MRSGNIWIDDSKLLDSGQYGYYWSCMPYPGTYEAFFMDFGDYVEPSYDYNPRYTGLPLRCLAS